MRDEIQNRVASFQASKVVKSNDDTYIVVGFGSSATSAADNRTVRFKQFCCLLHCTEASR